MRNRLAWGVVWLLVCTPMAFAADPVAGVPPIVFTLSDGSTVTGTLVRESTNASIAPGGQAVQVHQYSTQYEKGGKSRLFPLSPEEGRDVASAATQFADTARRYAVARSTQGYSAGEPIGLVLYTDRAGRLLRYGDLPRSFQDQLLPQHQTGDPLYIRVRYRFQDAERENHPGTDQMDPHGRLVLGNDGRVSYTRFQKDIAVHETRRGESRPDFAGVFPSITDAIAAARQVPPDTSLLRFAVDFGPQFNGAATAGTARKNQLMPIIPIGQVTNPRTREVYIAALPPDQLQAYRRGELGNDALLLIPPTALRYVHTPGDWSHIVDDYLDLRSTGREAARIFVANRRPVSQDTGRTEMMTLNSVAVFGRDNMDESLRSVRDNAPASLFSLDFRKKPPPSGGCGPALGGLKPNPPPS